MNSSPSKSGKDIRTDDRLNLRASHYGLRSLILPLLSLQAFIPSKHCTRQCRVELKGRIGMVLNGTIYGLLQPELKSKSTDIMWSLECFPKIKFFVSDGGNYLGQVVFVIIESLALPYWFSYLKGRGSRKVLVGGIDL